MGDPEAIGSDIPIFVKDVPNFVKDVPRVPKCVPRWGSTPNHFLMVAKGNHGPSILRWGSRKQ